MSDMEGAAATPEGTPAAPAAEPKATPEPDAKPKAEPKSDPKRGPEKPRTFQPEKNADKPADKTVEKPAKEDAGSLRKRLSEISNSESALRKEIESFKKQNQELSQRRIITPEVEQEMEANRQQIATMRQQMAEVAYERSDEFKRQFRDPWDNSLKIAIAAAEQMPILNEDGEVARQATPADFWKVASAPIGERARVARTLFGDNAIAVLSDIKDLERIKAASDHALRAHREDFTGKQKFEAERFQQQQRAYASQRDNARRELSEKYPDYFGASESDPESNEALKRGFEFVDNAAANGDKMPLEERAAYAEVVRARAAWFLRGHKELTRAKAKIDSLEAELTKLRGSDPGAEPAGDARGEKPRDENEVGEIESMSDRFERLGA